MMHRIRDLGLQAFSSLWLIPALITTALILLSIGLISLESNLHGLLSVAEEDWVPLGERYPRMFGSSAGGARAMLSTLAGALVTAAGVTLSGVLVTLSVVSAQYTSRILRSLTANRLHQVILGLILGSFAYSLIVLSVIEAGESSFVPTIAVAAAVPLGLLGVCALVLFVHNVSRSIQASEILASAARETEASIRNQFPEQASDTHTQSVAGRPENTPLPGLDGDTSHIVARESGYIRSVDREAIVAYADEHDLIVRMERKVGDFVCEGESLFTVAFLAATKAESSVRSELEERCTIGSFRTVEQDAAFGLRQMVDIALRALSPGVNDTTTGVMAVHRITQVLRLVLQRAPTSGRLFKAGKLRLIETGHDFATLCALGFDQVREASLGNAAANQAIIESAHSLASVATRRTDADAILTQVEAVERHCQLEDKPGWPDFSDAIERIKIRLRAVQPG